MANMPSGPVVGFAPNEVDLSLSARAARLKWVVVVNSGLPVGLAANAAVCVTAATAAAVPGLLGIDVADAEGAMHPALPWVGCPVLTADTATLQGIRARAAGYPDTFVADMPGVAQRTLVYAEYAAVVSKTGAQQMNYSAVSIVGPRNRVGKIVGQLPLMS